jgi:ATP-dependent protease HslVU (ClpYQ) peptidase subunit
MSVVAVRVSDNEISIASDSITVRGWTKSNGTNGHGKLIEVNDIILGAVGSAEESSLFQLYCSTRKPASASQASILEFVSEFAEWKRQKTNSFGIDNVYIMVFDRKAFTIEHFFVEEVLEYQAIGAGMDFALACLAMGTSVESAVRTACQLSAMCTEPIVQFEVAK